MPIFFTKKNQEKLIESAIEKFKEALPAAGQVDPDDHLFRRLTGDNRRDMIPLTHERMQNIAFHLYDTNPLAHRIIEMTKDFVIGDGLGYQVTEDTDEKVKPILDDFWNDPVNSWDIKQHQKVSEIGIYGEQCWPVFINETNGHVRLGYVDPVDVVAVITDPDNCEVVTHVKINVKGSEAITETKVLSVIREDENPRSPTFGKLTGECFYFTINKVSNATRGRSDLLPLADWIDFYDQFLFNRLDRAALINAFVWDITLEGMDEPAIRDWLKNNPTPKPGSIRAHNERVKWEAIAPDLKANDAAADAKLIKNYILAGAGFPGHWFADGGDVNRATATVMGGPTIKKLKSRQAFIKHIITFIFRFVLDQAKIAKELTEDADTSFSITAPDLDVQDIETISSALEKITKSLDQAIIAGLISQQKAIEIYVEFLNQFSNDSIDAQEEQDAIKEQNEADDNKMMDEPEGDDE